jgi:hypothetical protein
VENKVNDFRIIKLEYLFNNPFFSNNSNLSAILIETAFFVKEVFYWSMIFSMIFYVYLDIFPNPVQDELNFTFESSFNGDLEVIVTDVKGQRIMNFVIEKNTDKVSRVHNVTNLPNGVYQLTISNGNELTTKAFVK